MANAESEADLKPYADGTKLCAARGTAVFIARRGFLVHERKDTPDVFFWAAVPLHLAELKFKMEHGIDPLLELFDKNEVTDRIVPDRPSVV